MARSSLRRFALAGLVALAALAAAASTGVVRVDAQSGGNTSSASSAAATATGGGTAASNAGGGSGEAARRPVPVEVAPVTTQKMVETARFSGTLRPVRQVEIAASSGGLISDIRFKGGDQVKQGDVLVQLDDRVAKANLAEAEAALKDAQSKNDRNQELLKRGTVSEATAENTETELAVAEGLVNTAKAKLDVLTITAPFDGRMGFREVEVGSYAGVGSPLASIYDDTSLILEFDVPQRMLATLKVGDEVTCTSDAFADGACTGKIDVFDPVVNQSTRTITVRAIVPNDDGAMRGGAGVRVAVTTAVKDEALVVPNAAVVRTLLGYRVFRVENGVAKQVDVEIGARTEKVTEIVSGLSKGDMVVTLGQFQLEDGAPVTVSNAES